MLCGGLVTLAYLDLGSVMVPWCFLSVQLLQGTWQYRFASSLCSGAALAQRWVPASFHSPCRGLLQHESKNGKKLVSSPLRKVSCPNGTILNFVVCFWAVLRSQESLKKKKKWLLETIEWVKLQENWNSCWKWLFHLDQGWLHSEESDLEIPWIVIRLYGKWDLRKISATQWKPSLVVRSEKGSWN